MFVVTRATIRCWHHDVVPVRCRWSHPQLGRPPIDDQVRGIVLRVARENPRWGSPRIVGELRDLDLRVSTSTVRGFCAGRGSARRRVVAGRTGRRFWGPRLTVCWPVISSPSRRCGCVGSLGCSYRGGEPTPGQLHCDPTTSQTPASSSCAQLPCAHHRPKPTRRCCGVMRTSLKPARLRYSTSSSAPTCEPVRPRFRSCGSG